MVQSQVLDRSIGNEVIDIPLNTFANTYSVI